MFSKEVELADSMQTLFRGNSLASKIMTFCFKVRACGHMGYVAWSQLLLLYSSTYYNLLKFWANGEFALKSVKVVDYVHKFFFFFFFARDHGCQSAGIEFILYMAPVRLTNQLN